MLVALAALALASPALAQDGATERWAGTMSVFGERHIPLLGTIRYRTDTFVLSTATRAGDTWELEQSTCRVRFPKTAGATVTLDPDAPAKMPISRLAFRPSDADDTWSAGPWPSGWNDEDHDQDGNPGITIHVKAPLCGGQLFVESRAKTTASGAPGATTTLEGPVRIWVEQLMLGTKGSCLSMMVKDTAEWLEGRFAYVRVPDDATCASLAPDAWPDPAPDR